MNRAETTYRLLKEAGQEGLTTSDLQRATKLMDAGKAISEAKKEWLSDGERIVKNFERHSFLGWYGRRQARYFLIRNRE